MKNLLIGLVWLIAFSSFAQQTETRSLSSFRSIKVSQAIDTYLKKGDKEGVRVEVKDGKVSDVITDVEGSSLRIKMRDGRNFWNKVDVKVYVTYVTLEKISASSASSVFSEGTVKTSNLDINVSSAANVEISIEATSVMVDVSSAGEVVLEGKATNLEIEASSAGDVDTYRLESEAVNARCSSGADIKLFVSKELEARASSGGDIRYRGNPNKTNTQSSSGGSVKKSN
ncbi:MAG: hypothetical protein OJF59_003105 [Cytophagales bacterium]|jgi:hypothetical protein|nr:DUF2807 domain-containing protein [Bacteroidota bacterium]MBS1981330.1 DUF2807 domain-containing protein [Bacteroidota bacterium]WHZ09349.1 MAG: hypothetical protein OJF59_003105 [Cytophagales bacterium]